MQRLGTRPHAPSASEWRPSNCNTLQHTATHCNTLQHTATHCKIHDCITLRDTPDCTPPQLPQCNQERKRCDPESMAISLTLKKTQRWKKTNIFLSRSFFFELS